MKPTDHAYRNLSCQYITEALFRLMQKDDYNAITISEITQEAGVARRTFYLNYDSKEDVLDQHYAILIKEYDAGFTEEMGRDPRKQSEYFFTFWYNHREYARLLEKNGLLYMLVNRFYVYMSQTDSDTMHVFEDKERRYVFSYVEGGLLMMLQTWLKSDFQESPKELADMYVRISGFQMK